MGTPEGRGNETMNTENSPFLSRLDATAKDIDELLDRLLSATPAEGEISRPRAWSRRCAMQASVAASGSVPSWWWSVRPCSRFRGHKR